MRSHARTLLAAGLVAGVTAAMAGTVNVSFIDSTSYSDAGTSSWDEEANLKALAAHLQGLGQRLLPANQVLKVEVLDVDLAGTVQPSRRDGSSLRVLRGRTDWPRIHMRYTLAVDGKPGRSGDEWVADIDYARGRPGYRDSESLYYEKRMLDAWFKERFVDGRAAAG